MDDLSRQRLQAGNLGSPPAARRSPSRSPPGTPTTPNFDISLAGFTGKSAVLAEHCRTIRRDFDAITRSATYNMIVADTENDVIDRLAWLRVRMVSWSTQTRRNGRGATGDGRLRRVGRRRHG